MKKNKSTLLILVIAIALVLTSCSTTIAIKRLVPAKVDVSGYKTIGVRSTIDETRWVHPVFWGSYVPITGVSDLYLRYLAFSSYLDFNASSRITDAATNTIYKAINTGYFNVLDPQYTDSLVTVGQRNGNLQQTLMDNKVDAVLTTKITNIYYDEYISQERESYYSTDKGGIKYYRINFYLYQKYQMSISYTLSDVENNKIIATDTFTSDSMVKKTRLGYTIDSYGTFQRESYFNITPASRLFEDLIQQFADKFRTELSPHYETHYFDFMPNKNPKVDRLEPAYDALEDENWATALRLFADEYKKSGNIAAGYNAAILYFTQGQYEQSYALAQELYNKYGNVDALDLYNVLKNIEAQENAANAQISSTEKSGASTTTGSGGVVGI
ncbi:MAG: tetratricopeptide repeat protein [Sphaerochaetaceae bacterium]|nr:tetratricopeptide repeat protein [Sphaerochaetaceae bacterium]